MKTKKLIFGTGLLLLGSVLFVLADIDDSPGGQLIGCIIGFIGVYKLFKK